jgi:hypothetical protein
LSFFGHPFVSTWFCGSGLGGVSLSLSAIGGPSGRQLSFFEASICEHLVLRI